MNKIRQLISLAVALIGLLPAIAQQTMSLDGTWKFAYCKNSEKADTLVANRFFDPGFDLSKFDDCPVPSNWAVLGYEEPIYRGFIDEKASEGLYVKDFTLKSGLKRVLLHFGGVWASAEVWVNGKWVGRHDSGFTSFDMDISRVVDRSGKRPNRVAVRVRQVHPTYKFDVNDDWTLGGIYRSVSLKMMPNALWIDHVDTQQAFSDNYRKAILTARVFVCDKQKQLRPGNYPSPGLPYLLKATLKDSNGTVVATSKQKVDAHVSTGRQTDLKLDIKNPLLWNAETPNLYKLDIELFLPKGGKLNSGKVVPEGVVVDALAFEDDGDRLGTISDAWETTPHMRWTDRIGLREISTSLNGVPTLAINGKPVTLRGVNYHNEHPAVGRAQNREMWIKDLEQMKRTNINYLRLCHYPHAQEFVELCDSMGFYCSEEIALGGAGDQIFDPSRNTAVMLRTHETVARDLNRPSIIAWSVGNEDAFTPLHQVSAKLCRALDPSRPRFIPWRYENDLPKEDIDILSVHYWHPSECDSLTLQADRPVISSEYTHAFGEMGMGGLDARFAALTRHPQGAGAAIWMWQDQGLTLPTPVVAAKPNKMAKGDKFLRISDAGWDGIVDSYRRVTRDWEETRAVYCPVRPVNDTINISSKQSKAVVSLYNGYDFSDMADVDVAWKCFDGEGKLLGKGSLNCPKCAPHEAAGIELPCAGAEYAHLEFTNGNGMPMGSHSVCFVNVDKKKTSHKLSPEIEALLATMKPCLWRKLDNSEASVVGRKLVRNAPNWSKVKIEQTGDNSYRYVYNDSNWVDFSYVATKTNGGIRVDYTINPVLTVPRVPVAGISLTMPDAMADLCWRGLGPVDCYPNKMRAGLEGVWTRNDFAAPATDNPAGSLGTKRIAWVETNGMHIDCDGYCETDGNTLRLLSGVAARPEKGRPANHEYPELGTTAADPAMNGSFYIYKREG